MYALMKMYNNMNFFIVVLTESQKSQKSIHIGKLLLAFKELLYSSLRMEISCGIFLHYCSWLLYEDNN